MGSRATLYSKISTVITPEYIQKLSKKLNLPLKKTQNAYKVIMPSLLMAFTHHGPSVTHLITKRLNEDELLEGLFGNELTNFATKLQYTSELSLPGVISMIKHLADPMARVLKDYLRGEDLSSFLENETNSLAELVPTDISNHFNYGASSTKMGHVSRFIEGTYSKLTPYPKD